MILRPDPPRPGRSLDDLTDKELVRFEKPTASSKAGYIPAFPQRVLQAVVDADAVAALPLVLARIIQRLDLFVTGAASAA
jgi:hypothetical protein